jgi:LemA protein
MMLLLVLIVLIVVAGLWAMGIFNGLVTGRNAYKNAFAQIDVQLKRRYDLIPNLVETVKGYAAHEKSTFEAVTAARANAIQAQESGSPAQQAQAENALTGTLKSLFAVAEAYPDLKANQNMLALQEELTVTENKIGFARQAFNDAATAYNIRREVFPAVKVAGMFGFKEAALLETAETERAAPKVSFQ